MAKDDFKLFQSDALAFASPSGKMSKRARKDGLARIRRQIFGDDNVDLRGEAPQPSKKELLLRHATQLRELAERGMNSKVYFKKAQQLEAEADSL